MKTQFETEVSAALASRAADLPPGTVSRLRAVDYRPRGSRVRTPVAVGVVAGAATAGTVLSVVVLGSAPAAYAGWSAMPASDTMPSATAAADCQSQLESGPTTLRRDGSPGAWQTVLTDVRGPFTVALYQDGSAYAACFTSSMFTEVNQIEGNPATGPASGSLSVRRQSGSTGAPTSVPRVSIESTSSGALQSVVQSDLATASDGPYTLVDGRTQSGVTGVTLALDDGQDVVATVADGWFIAWWPGRASATSAQIATSSGTTSEPLVSAPKVGPGGCTPVSVPPSSRSGGPASACRGSGSAPSNSGNTTRSTSNTGGTSNTGPSGSGGKSGPG